MSMFANKFTKFLTSRLRPYTYCDSLESPSLIEQAILLADADALAEQEKSKIRPPIQYDNLKSTIQQNSINTFDGFRLVVQKQANLNTVVSHFYWLGSQATNQPIYQYRVIMPFDDKMINVATDMDFNIEGEIKYPFTPNISSKTNFVIGEQANNLTIDIDYVDQDSSTQFQYLKSTDSILSVGRMQALTPHLSLGGLGRFSIDKGTLETSLGGLFDDNKTLVVAEWDSAIKVLFVRKVNPNRVHLSSELVVDENDSKVSVAAEYILKQSKIQVGIDSNLFVKSHLETAMSPGVTLQFSAEMNQMKEHYRFGYGIVMG